MKIWPRPDAKCLESLLKLQKRTLSRLIEILTEHCIMGTHAKRMNLRHLTNYFYRSSMDEEEKYKNTLHWVPTTLKIFASCRALNRII